MKNINEMNSIIKEFKEYAELEEQLKAQMEVLKTRAIEILGEEAIDEYTCDNGKVTYRQVISKRLDTTLLKKTYSEIYENFVRPTTSMRFTCC